MVSILACTTVQWFFWGDNTTRYNFLGETATVTFKRVEQYLLFINLGYRITTLLLNNLWRYHQSLCFLTSFCTLTFIWVKIIIALTWNRRSQAASEKSGLTLKYKADLVSFDPITKYTKQNIMACRACNLTCNAKILSLFWLFQLTPEKFSWLTSLPFIFLYFQSHLTTIYEILMEFPATASPVHLINVLRPGGSNKWFSGENQSPILQKRWWHQYKKIQFTFSQNLDYWPNIIMKPSLNSKIMVLDNYLKFPKINNRGTIIFSKSVEKVDDCQ